MEVRKLPSSKELRVVYVAPLSMYPHNSYVREIELRDTGWPKVTQRASRPSGDFSLDFPVPRQV